MRYGNYAGEVEDNIVRYRKISRTPHERGYQVVKNCNNMLSCSDTISECDGRTNKQTDGIPIVHQYADAIKSLALFLWTNCILYDERSRQYSHDWSQHVMGMLSSIGCIDRVKVFGNVLNNVMPYLINYTCSQKLNTRRSSNGTSRKPLKTNKLQSVAKQNKDKNVYNTVT